MVRHMNYYAQRRQALVRDLKRDGFEALLISNPVHVTYLTGFTGDSSYFLTSPKHNILISDTRFEAQIAEECAGLDVVIRGHDKTTEDALGETLTKAKLDAVGVETRHATLALMEVLKEAAPKCTFAPAGARVEELRVIKDASEVEAIREAVRIAERAYGMFRSMMRETDTEKDLADAMEAYVRRSGGTHTPFPVIAAVGERGALPHAPPTNRMLISGSKLLLDWGAVYQGYRSDLTRTFRSPFQMVPTRKNKPERVGYDFEEIYNVVLEAQQAAIDLICDGVAAKDVDTAARKVISDAGYGDYFTHGLGHGLGLDTHEGPRLRKNSTDTLQAGMVVTVEPGIYIPGWGGVRIEDDVLVRRDGNTVLSTLPRGLAEIEAFA
ncbi:aminopeptidase P family protein [soil metagenome]